VLAGGVGVDGEGAVGRHRVTEAFLRRQHLQRWRRPRLPASEFDSDGETLAVVWSCASSPRGAENSESGRVRCGGGFPSERTWRQPKQQPLTPAVVGGGEPAVWDSVQYGAPWEEKESTVRES
jgi:hypothetical protein